MGTPFYVVVVVETKVTGSSSVDVVMVCTVGTPS